MKQTAILLLVLLWTACGEGLAQTKKVESTKKVTVTLVRWPYT